MAEKPHLNLIIIGHVDNGKSTTVGRLLYATGVLTDRDMARYKKSLPLSTTDPRSSSHSSWTSSRKRGSAV